MVGAWASAAPHLDGEAHVPWSDRIFLIVISLNLLLLASWLALSAVYRGQGGASSFPPIIGTAAVLALVVIGGVALNSSAKSIETDRNSKDVAAEIAKIKEEISNVRGGIAELKGKIGELRGVPDALHNA